MTKLPAFIISTQTLGAYFTSHHESIIYGSNYLSNYFHTFSFFLFYYCVFFLNTLNDVPHSNHLNSFVHFRIHFCTKTTLQMTTIMITIHMIEILNLMSGFREAVNYEAFSRVNLKHCIERVKMRAYEVPSTFTEYESLRGK